MFQVLHCKFQNVRFFKFPLPDLKNVQQDYITSVTRPLFIVNYVNSRVKVKLSDPNA